MSGSYSFSGHSNPILQEEDLKIRFLNFVGYEPALWNKTEEDYPRISVHKIIYEKFEKAEKIASADGKYASAAWKEIVSSFLRHWEGIADFKFNRSPPPYFDHLRYLVDHLPPKLKAVAEPYYARKEIHHEPMKDKMGASELNRKNEEIRRVKILKERARRNRELVEKRLQVIDRLTRGNTLPAHEQLLYTIGKVLRTMLNPFNSTADSISDLLVSLHCDLQKHELALSSSAFGMAFLAFGDCLVILAENELGHQDCLEKRFDKLKEERSVVIREIDKEKMKIIMHGSSYTGQLMSADHLLSEVNHDHNFCLPSSSVNHDHDFNLSQPERRPIHHKTLLAQPGFVKSIPLAKHLQSPTAIVNPLPMKRPRDAIDPQTNFSNADGSVVQIPFECSFCQEIFDNLGTMQKHEEIMHGKLRPKRQLPAPSPSASSTTDSSEEEEEEERNAPRLPFAPTARKPRAECPLCGETFTSLKGFSEHLQRNHPDNDGRFFDCNICGRCYRSYATMMGHRQVRHQRNYFPDHCDVCPEVTFRRRKDFAKHLLRAHNKVIGDMADAAVCPFCDQIFVSSKQLSEHILLDHQDVEEKVYECDLCTEAATSCKTPLELQEHYRKEHKQDEEPRQIRQIFQCITCKISCKTIRDLSVHAMSLHGKKTYLVDCCLTFAHTTNELVEHRRTHIVRREDSMYVCDVCQFQYSTQQSLIMHMATRHKIKFIPSGVQTTTQDPPLFEPPPELTPMVSGRAPHTSSSGAMQFPVRVISRLPPSEATATPVYRFQTTTHIRPGTVLPSPSSSSRPHESPQGPPGKFLARSLARQEYRDKMRQKNAHSNILVFQDRSP